MDRDKQTDQDKRGPIGPDLGMMPGMNSSPTGSSFRDGGSRQPGSSGLVVSVTIAFLLLVVVVLCLVAIG
ncbi:Protein of unknown function [Propionibacterium freudenreichii]|nr:Protein of unknown function [Propionibacterium freudenreichii]CEI26082.1 Protein of unknown function [Propionibacterium freudenreichii]CEI26581.1 Protein of unknown function [Propionibacterium freudenreichii]CEI49335.1 Protein of unknown function [Propionibacterium freudenreichii]SBN42921.1 Hypothetical protein PFR_J18_583 [Propionibacterium freudenreichii]